MIFLIHLKRAEFNVAVARSKLTYTDHDTFKKIKLRCGLMFIKNNQFLL